MSEIPGSAPTELNENQNHNQPTAHSNPEWVKAKTRGRWADFWNGRTYNPPKSDARKKAREQKYAWARLNNPKLPDYVPVHLCMGGNELLAERERIGDGTSFRAPRTDEARELVALLPHGRLRAVDAHLLAALAYAMLTRQRYGLIATLENLGKLVGLRTTATGEAMARLIALGFVHPHPTYTAFGACESQRGNLWRLTAQAVEAYALLVPHGVELPDGTVDRARLQRRRLPVGSRARATTLNPGANPDALSKRENNCDPFRNGARPAPAVGGAESASPSGSIFSVPAERHLPSQPARRQDETCQSSGKPGRGTGSRAAAASIVEELAELVSDPVARAAILAAARKGGAS